MANILESKLGELVRAGAQVTKDGKLGFADPKLNEAWKQWVATNGNRSNTAATVPDTSAESLDRAARANAINLEARVGNNRETERTAAAMLPIVEGKTGIQTKAYGDRLNARVGAYGDLLGQSQTHESALYDKESDRLAQVLANDKYYLDTVNALNEKQLQQQGTANILNLITNLALGGAALFA